MSVILPHLPLLMGKERLEVLASVRASNQIGISSISVTKVLLIKFND